MNVLVVDDNPTNLQIISDLVRRVGFTVFAAADGFSALRVFLSQGFDIILVDFRMSPLTGLETVEMFRLIEQDLLLKRSFIIGMSGSESHSMASEFERAGADAYLNIPFTLESLKKILNSRI